MPGKENKDLNATTKEVPISQEKEIPTKDIPKKIEGIENPDRKLKVVNEYLRVFNDNYYGRSEQAAELKEQLKKRQSGSVTVSYIPWATMLRMATQQDPNFTLIKEVDENGSFAHYHGSYNADGSSKDDAAYFVKVTATFLGKTITEEYPLQDFAFEPLNFSGRKHVSNAGKVKEIQLDANAINKSLQRASAKVLSIITGIGLSLYESGDLQFEEDAKPKDADKPMSAATAKEMLKKNKDSKKVVTDPKKVDKTTGEIKKEAEVPMATKEQIKTINDLNKDEKNAMRLKVALSSYKAKTFEDFSEAQATIIINALSKSVADKE